jgi:molybdopterin-guanine dinucleotide biosynthesis protein A
MVATRGESTEPVPLRQIAGITKFVPQDHLWVRSARHLGIALGDWGLRSIRAPAPSLGSMSLLGAVLAGGRSSRMGTDKAALEVHGVSFLDRVASAVGQVTSRVVVLGGERPGYESWPDETSVSGPLAGVATALNRMTEECALVLAVDNPFVDVETLRRMTGIESDLPVVPVDHDGVRQVTCAIYPKAIAPQAMEEAVGGGSIQTLLDRVSFHPVTPDVWESWGEDGRSWYSVDSPESLGAGLRQFG